MRVAVDATAIPRQRAGAGTYTYWLVDALARSGAVKELTVFAKPGTLDGNAALAAPGVTICWVRLGSRLQRMLWEQTALPLQLRRRRLELLHSPHHTTPLAPLPCRRVVTVHDVTFFVLPHRYPWLRRCYFRAVTRQAALRADAVITVSDSSKADIHRVLGLPEGRVHAIPLAAAPTFTPERDPGALEALRRRYGLPPRYVLSVGTLEPGKNRDALLRAFARLRDAGLDHALVVAGPRGWRQEGLDDTVKELSLRDRVLVLGYVPEEDLPDLYRGAELFAFPSLHEGFGLPALEALACGTPVVASNGSAMPEVLDGAALLVDPRDVGALAQAMVRVLTDADLAADLRARGPERARLFSWERTARETLAVYRQVLAGGT